MITRSGVIRKSTETNIYYLNLVQLITGFTKQYQKDGINNKRLQRFIVDIYCDVTQGATLIVIIVCRSQNQLNPCHRGPNH